MIVAEGIKQKETLKAISTREGERSKANKQLPIDNYRKQKSRIKKQTAKQKQVKQINLFKLGAEMLEANDFKKSLRAKANTIKFPKKKNSHTKAHLADEIVNE